MLNPNSASPGETGPSTDARMALALRYDLFVWREQLARSIARNNLDLRSDGIATAVNQIICRLLFLLMAEDRGLMPEGILRSLSDADDPYGTLMAATGILDDLWTDLLPQNSPRPGTGSVDPMATLALEDTVMTKILARLTSQDRPYDFTVISLEWIADVFRIYLGRTVRRSATHQAIIVDMHDTVLSGSVLSPGESLVDYMVQATLSQAAANRSRREILPLRIVDPACGPGRVLVCAFRQLTAALAGTVQTSDERREVLAGSLHGVDADRHAVAVARLLLAVGFCDGVVNGGPVPANPETLPAVLMDIIPVLRSAIRHGNPLIGPEIARDESWAFCPARERHTLNPFSWETAYPEIFAAGGFDGVLGIFPEGPVDRKEWIQQYFQRHYAAFDPGADRSTYFVEKGLSLLRPGGTLGCCMGGRWMRGKSGGPFRSVLATKQVEELIDLPATEGGEDDRSLCILRLTSRPPSHVFPVAIVNPGFAGDPVEYIAAHRFPVEPAQLDAGGWVFRDSRKDLLLEKLAAAGTRLDDVVMGQVGTGTGAGIDRRAIIDQDERDTLVRTDLRSKTFIHPCVSAGDISRFRIAGRRFAIIVPPGWTDAHNKTAMSPWRWFKRRHPGIARLLKKSAGGEAVPPEKADHWWEADAGNILHEDRHAIIFPAVFRDPAFALDDGRAIVDTSLASIASASPYLLGLLNSRLIAFILENSRQQKSGEIFFSWEDIRELPIYTPDLDERTDCARSERLATLVTRMIDRQKKVLRAGTDRDREHIECGIAAIDHEIDMLVYELYGLTKEEISVVEEASPS